MKQKLVFATNNRYKLDEIRAVAGNQIEVIGLDEAGFEGEIPEDHDSLEENALQKARYIKGKTGYDCFADDTGLEVDALDGRPGVYSARYAGPQCNAEDNIRKLLSEMQGIRQRSARFRTVIALIMNGREYLFEGVAEGQIITEKHGGSGFGYDPVFLPENHRHTFAEMDISLKNKISHRAKAVSKLVDFLEKPA
jgi:XTP/dITP diphosphohydrolase